MIMMMISFASVRFTLKLCFKAIGLAFTAANVVCCEQSSDFVLTLHSITFALYSIIRSRTKLPQA